MKAEAKQITAIRRLRQNHRPTESAYGDRAQHEVPQSRSGTGVEGLAAREGVSVRTIQKAVRELEEWGLVEKSGRKGLNHYFVVTRDPNLMPAVKSRNAPRLAKRREQFGEFGRRGAAARASRAAQAKAKAQESSPLSENNFVPDEKDPSPRTDIVKQSFVNRAPRNGRKRKRREELSMDYQHAGKSSVPTGSGKGSYVSQFSGNSFSTNSHREPRGEIDWNGWIDALSEHQTRSEAIHWIYGAIDKLRDTLLLNPEQAQEKLDRLLRRARAMRLQLNRSILDRLLNDLIDQESRRDRSPDSKHQ